LHPSRFRLERRTFGYSLFKVLRDFLLVQEVVRACVRARAVRLLFDRIRHLRAQFVSCDCSCCQPNLQFNGARGRFERNQSLEANAERDGRRPPLAYGRRAGAALGSRTGNTNRRSSLTRWFHEATDTPEGMRRHDRRTGWRKGTDGETHVPNWLARSRIAHAGGCPVAGQLP